MAKKLIIHNPHTSDLDGDGDVDIVVANWGSDTISILRNSNRGADISLDKKILSFGDVSVGVCIWGSKG